MWQLALSRRKRNLKEGIKFPGFPGCVGTMSKRHFPRSRMTNLLVWQLIVDVMLGVIHKYHNVYDATQRSELKDEMLKYTNLSSHKLFVRSDLSLEPGVVRYQQQGEERPIEFQRWALKTVCHLNLLSPLRWRTGRVWRLEPAWLNWGSAQTSVSSSSCWS